MPTYSNNGYIWEIQFVNKDNEDLGKDCDGRCIPSKLLIVIREDLCPQMLKETLIHELVHATLDAQGRYSQRKFTHEELCEFVGWCGEKIINYANKVCKYREEHPNEI